MQGVEYEENEVRLSIRQRSPPGIAIQRNQRTLAHGVGRIPLVSGKQVRIFLVVIQDHEVTEEDSAKYRCRKLR